MLCIGDQDDELYIPNRDPGLSTMALASWGFPKRPLTL